MDQNQLDAGNDLGSDGASKKHMRPEAKEKERLKKGIMKQFFKDTEYNDDILNDYTKTPIRELEGHQRAVRDIAYSETHKIIVSCGFDFEVFVWNPYMHMPIMSLDGHEHPLVGVNCLPALNCFITADAKGMVKVWNILDYSCIQTFYVTNVNQVTCIRAVPKHRRLLCGSRSFKVFQYQRPFIPEFSDDNPICCAKFSTKNFEIYVAGQRSIKIWDAKTGKPVRVLKNVFSSEITTMEFDEHHRKLIIGSR
jgi:WD40 repeat protein